MNRIGRCAHCARDEMVIKGRGLCSLCWHYYRSEYPVTKHMRPYTARERDYVLSHWRRIPAARIAAVLGRQLNDVYAAAGRFGCRQPQRNIDREPWTLRRLRALHRHGNSNCEIARKLGMALTTVSCVLRRHGLRANGVQTKSGCKHTERTRQLQRRIVLERIARDGREAVCNFSRNAARRRAAIIRYERLHLPPLRPEDP